MQVISTTVNVFFCVIVTSQVIESAKLESRSSMDDESNWRETIVDLHNQYRAEEGLSALSYNYQLQAAAEGHNDVMADNDCFEHQCPGESAMGDRIQAAGYEYSACAENLIVGYDTVQEAVKGWMESPGHRDNIMNNDYTELGCAWLTCTGCQYSSYWTCNYGHQS